MSAYTDTTTFVVRYAPHDVSTTVDWSTPFTADVNESFKNLPKRRVARWRARNRTARKSQQRNRL